MGMYEEDMGLNDDLYSTLRSQILALDLQPPLDKIFNMTQQEENHKKFMMTRDIRSKTTMLFVAREQPAMVEKPGCKICGRYGHDENICYEVIGYPTGWGTHGRGRGNRGAQNSRGDPGGGHNKGNGMQ